MKLLVVDDQEDIIRMVLRRLKKCRYEIHTATDGKEGIEKAFEVDPDLILMDMHMPVMDGYSAVRNLREKGYKGLIVAHTASAMVNETQEALEAGCDEFITKPIGQDFEETIHKFLLRGKK